MKTRTDKRMVKLDSLFSPKLPFLDVSQKSFFDAWALFFSVHIWCTPNEGPKDFVNGFFNEIGPRSRTIMEKGHLPWSDFMVHGVNGPKY